MEEFRGYRIYPVQKLGEGGFGYVESIKLYNPDGVFCGDYARKVLSPNQHVIASVTWEEIRRRFEREVIYQSKCASSYVMPVYIFNMYAEQPYFIMDLGVDDLQGVISKGALEDSAKKEIVKMCLLGLKAIHDKGYLHRDIKPQNILRFEDGLYKISDFGLVKNTDPQKAGTDLTAIGQIMGTRRFMAPEILYNAEYSKSTDIFALGQVLIDLDVHDKSYKDVFAGCVSMQKEVRYADVDKILNDLNI